MSRVNLNIGFVPANTLIKRGTFIIHDGFLRSVKRSKVGVTFKSSRILKFKLRIGKFHVSAPSIYGMPEHTWLCKGKKRVFCKRTGIS